MSITEFIPIGLKNTEVAGKVNSESGADLKGRVMVMCLKPLLFGVWVPDENATPLQIILDSNTKSRAVVSGVAEHYLELEEGLFCFWKPYHTRLTGLSLKQRAVELPRIFAQSRKSKFRFSYAEVKHLTAGYFYPRKIYVVVVEHETYLNVFPMDLHMHHPETNDYAFSLQVTNLATAEIKKAKKVLVCQLGSQSLKTAYALGKTMAVPDLRKMNWLLNLIEVTTLVFLLPEFAMGYKEIRIDQYVDFPSHTIFLGEVANEKGISPELRQPFHIHRFCFPYQNSGGDNIPKLGL